MAYEGCLITKVSHEKRLTMGKNQWPKNIADGAGNRRISTQLMVQFSTVEIITQEVERILLHHKLDPDRGVMIIIRTIVQETRTTCGALQKDFWFSSYKETSDALNHQGPWHVRILYWIRILKCIKSVDKSMKYWENVVWWLGQNQTV